MAIEVIKNNSQPQSFAQVLNKSFAEFFAGIGLMRMGLERQGWSLTIANDIDPQKKKMYEGPLALHKESSNKSSLKISKISKKITDK